MLCHRNPASPIRGIQILKRRMIKTGAQRPAREASWA
jgi:hypothetical protein